MLSDLVTLGRRLREDGKIPQPGFADYSEPIRWTLAVHPPTKAGDAWLLGLIEDGCDQPRPDSGRTSGVFAYPLVDTAAYVLGIEEKSDRKIDPNAADKHKAFLQRLQSTAEEVESEYLRKAVLGIRDGIKAGGIQLTANVKADHWVAIEVRNGPLAGLLFEHPEVQALWQAEMEATVIRNNDVGICSVTGVEGPVVFRVPGKGYFGGKATLLGLDKDAFISYTGGAGASDNAHIGVSYEAADLANRALEYLSRNRNHRRVLVYDKDSSLRSVTSLLWMDINEPVVLEQENEIRELAQEDLIALITAPVDTFGEDQNAPKADLRDVQTILKAPLTGKHTGLDLDTVNVHLAVLSKNAYRIVIRDYRTETLAHVRRHLLAFLDAASLPAPDSKGRVRKPRPVSIHEMLRTTYGIVDDSGKHKASATKSTNHARALFRTAYFGTPPPLATLQPALARIRTLMTKEDDPNRPFRLHALLSLVKLILTHQTANAMTLEPLGSDRNERAFRCGELLAVLGRIQQDALTDDNKKTDGGATLNRTITERYFASASLAPSAYLGTLVQRATTAHIPKLPENWKTDGSTDYRKTAGWALDHLQVLSKRIHELGGYPHTLDLKGQGEFALGYYHQRAQFFGGGKSVTPEPPISETPSESSDLFTPTS